MSTATALRRPAGNVVVDTAYRTQSILTPATGFIKDYDYVLNPYSGCAFGCQYCYAANFVREPHLNEPPTPYTQANWGKWVRGKQNAPALIGKRVRNRHLDRKSIYMSTATDPYQPTERHQKLTRRILAELANARDLGLVIQTRGVLADNPADLASCRHIITNGGHVQMNMTITTNDEQVRKAIEPTCPSYLRRLDAIANIAAQNANTPNYTTCVTITPLLPTDHPQQFATDLLNAGIRRFIIQPTHTGSVGQGRFRAATRNELVIQLAEYWGISPHDVPKRYARLYTQTVKAIVPSLEANGALVGFGRAGFARPWRREWHTDQSERPECLPDPPRSAM